MTRISAFLTAIFLAACSTSPEPGDKPGTDNPDCIGEDCISDPGPGETGYETVTGNLSTSYGYYAWNADMTDVEFSEQVPVEAEFTLSQSGEEILSGVTPGSIEVPAGTYDADMWCEAHPVQLMAQETVFINDYGYDKDVELHAVVGGTWTCEAPDVFGPLTTTVVMEGNQANFDGIGMVTFTGYNKVSYDGGDGTTGAGILADDGSSYTMWIKHSTGLDFPATCVRN